MSRFGPHRWPVSLAHGPVGLRPIRRRDARAWFEARGRNGGWTTPWDGTRPSDAAEDDFTFEQGSRVFQLSSHVHKRGKHFWITAPDGSKKTLVVDVGRILKEGTFEEDVPLQEGDVVIVPEKGLLGL